MMRRVAVMLLAAGGLALGLRAQAVELRPAVDRPEIMEIGDPILITRKVLGLEMRRNVDLRDWVHLYGAPDYAEVQEIQIDPPWAPYEVRLYYIRRNAYLAFSRVNVAPNVYDYGVRKYVGPIEPDVLDRLLSAEPAGTPLPPPAGPAAVAPAVFVIETQAIEGVPIKD
jgi:hypothetical protein